MLDAARFLAILDAHTRWRPCDDVPEISAWHADDETALWHALEVEGHAEVPYYAIPWPSARVMARSLLDGVVDVKGARVADIGCGSGVVACAAAMRGARVTAMDVDAHASLAAVELAHRNGARVTSVTGDALDRPELAEADVIVCADLVSREAHAAPFARAVHAWRARGARVVLADSGRPFFDPHGASLLFEREVSAHAGVDSAGTRVVRVYA